MRNLGRALLVLLGFACVATPAAAEHRDWRDAGLQELAHQLERATRHLHRSAEEVRHGGSRERKALKALHKLEDRAVHFHARVERYHPDYGHALDDFRKLHRRFEKARKRFYGLHAYQHLSSDLARVEGLIYAIEARLSYARADRHYERGHYDRRDYDDVTYPRWRGWVSWRHRVRHSPC